jgi:hypothetical protein
VASLPTEKRVLYNRNRNSKIFAMDVEKNAP